MESRLLKVLALVVVFSLTLTSAFVATRTPTAVRRDVNRVVQMKIDGKESVHNALDDLKEQEAKDESNGPSFGQLTRRSLIISSLLAAGQFGIAQAYAPSGFKRIPTQFIAALGDPQANSGAGAQDWGLWTLDPGPRGVWLRDYPKLEAAGGAAPAGWRFDKQDWWLEEHGLIMEAPTFPLPEGRYLVTGGRQTTTALTVGPGGAWALEDPKAKLYDVTHLPCRSARYTPNEAGAAGSPAAARPRDFPVAPGAEMPAVPGCAKQDYAVLFVIGVPAEGAAK